MEKLTFVSELAKGIDVPIAPHVDLKMLTEGDDEPLFITLAVAEKQTSKNGLIYDDGLIRELGTQINAGGITGIFGHIPEEEVSTAFPPAEVFWVGAKRVKGILYAKGYLASERAKTFYRKAQGALVKAATSIFGMGVRKLNKDGTHTMSEFQLQQLDFAPYHLAAAPAGDGSFVLTSEMVRGPRSPYLETVQEYNRTGNPAHLAGALAQAIAENEALRREVQQSTGKPANPPAVTKYQPNMTDAEFSAYTQNLKGKFRW